MLWQGSTDYSTSSLRKNNETELDSAVHQYETSFLQESELIDELVSTAYLTMGDFKRFTAACMILLCRCHLL